MWLFLLGLFNDTTNNTGYMSQKQVTMGDEMVSTRSSWPILTL